MDFPAAAAAPLYVYLQPYLTARRQALFERVLAYRTRHFVLAVEDTFQAQNASALVRTCECVGVQSVHIIENFNPYLIERGIARGAEKWLDLHVHHAHADNAADCTAQLRTAGYRLVATVPDADATALADFDLQQPAAFLFGSEKKGLSPTLLAAADARLRIPMYGFTESYNVSVAAALVLYTLTERLRATLPPAQWQLPPDVQAQKRAEWAIRSLRRGPELAARFLTGWRPDQDDEGVGRGAGRGA